MLLLRLQRAQTYCRISTIGTWFVHQGAPCGWAIPASHRGRAGNPEAGDHLLRGWSHACAEVIQIGLA